LSEAAEMIRRIRQRVTSGLKSATFRYAGGISTLLLLGVAGEVSSSALLKQGSVASNLVGNFSEAVLVSAFLAILVDPFLKWRLQGESGWHALFGYLNPRAPKELKEAIRQLAECRRFNAKTDWTVNYAWYDEARTILAVTLECANTGINIDTKPYRPNGRPWVLASCDGMQTQYLRYFLTCPGYFAQIDLSDGDLAKFVIRRDDGSIYIDEAALVEHRSVPPGVTYETVKRARMYRHTTAYVPIHHGQFIDQLQFILTGPALRDLEITIAHPRQEGRRLPNEWKVAAETGPVSQQLGRATPGQVTLLSWSPAHSGEALRRA
jgi:hypothetical protein